jgi:hypothetical protein
VRPNSARATGNRCGRCLLEPVHQSPINVSMMAGAELRIKSRPWFYWPHP